RGPLLRRKPQGKLEQARVLREGRQVTVVSYAAVLNKALEVADKLSTDGIDVEVIDLRCINPIDFDTIATSARKTSRVIIAHEDTFT
ncbi:transketolase C-terminal domain-containing protein, partial [Klebsiella aerogenes]|uniref:transketolase C-terminal domain-containing protein n=1 Tax=Klebsiella aerogenes TaxID=548 RepID=UPI0027D2BFA5